MDGMPNGGRYVGLKSVFEEYFPRMLSHFEESHANPIEFLSIDDKVIVFGRIGVIKNMQKFYCSFLSHVLN